MKANFGLLADTESLSNFTGKNNNNNNNDDDCGKIRPAGFALKPAQVTLGAPGVPAQTGLNRHRPDVKPVTGFVPTGGGETPEVGRPPAHSDFSPDCRSVQFCCFLL